MTFSIGADPEVFVQDKGKFVSAHDMVKGTKWDPFPVKDGAVQVDGMALEFNIDPAYSEEEFLAKMDSVYHQLREMIGEKEFLQQCSVFFEDKDIVDVPLFNLQLGCEPDFNAYTMIENPTPNASLNMRTAGGHIHVGGFETDNEYTQEQFELSATIARAMDKYVGVYSLLWDKDDQRRTLYGKAGSFRPKQYGMEYRTLSNAWMFSKDIMSFIYQQTVKAVDSVMGGEVIDDTYADIINNSIRGHAVFNDSTAKKLKEVLYG